MDTEDLNRLIRELNAGRPGRGAARPAPTHQEPDGPDDDAPPVVEGLRTRLASWLAAAAEADATDLLLVPGAPPTLRVHGRLESLHAEPLQGRDAESMLLAVLPAGRRQRYAEEGTADFAFSLAGLGRFRVNLHRTRLGSAAALRRLPSRVPPIRELGLPAVLHDLVRRARGLVLVTGPTGSGKTTTLAALVDAINRTERLHVVTIEDPVEYEHSHQESVIEQLEVGTDVPSFAGALRAVLRQDPDVILVGEVRDLETMRTALTAAETGHLVLATLHTNDAAQTVHRIVDVFPAQQQAQVRQQLSLALLAIVSQQLVPRTDGRGRALACEVLIANDAIRHQVRQGTLHQLHTEMTIGRRAGMVTMEESLARLVARRTITETEARLRASHPDELSAFLRDATE